MIPGIIAIPSNIQKSISFVTSVGTTVQNGSYTFSSVPLGVPDTTRYVVIGVNYYQFDFFGSITSLSVAGVAATSIGASYRVLGDGFSSVIYSWLFGVTLPTSVSSGNISVVFDRSPRRGCEVGVFALYGLQSTTPVSITSGSTGGDAAAPVVLSANVQANDVGVVLSTGAYNFSPGSFTWTGADQVYATDRGIGTPFRGAAMFQATQNQTPRTITAQSPDGSIDSTNIAAIWR